MRHSIERAIIVGHCIVIAALGGEPFIGLGIDQSQPHSFATGVSNDGTVVVGYKSGLVSGAQGLGFRWTFESGIQSLPIPGGDAFSQAVGVTGDGSTIALATYLAGGSPSGAYLFRDGQLIPLPPALPGYSRSAVAAISRSGDATLGVLSGTSVPNRNVIWDQDFAITEFSLPPDGRDVVATGISTTSPPVVVGMTTFVPRFSFRWTQQGGFEPLPDLSGGPTITTARGISPDATVIVGSGASSVAIEAVRWVEGVPYSLGRLANETESEALAVSSGGSVIVGRAMISGSWRAFIWTGESGKRLLSDVLTNDYGVDLWGWTLLRASAVSDDGRFVVGEGTTRFGTEAFLVTLAPACPPLRSDINGDGAVDIQDLALLLADFGLRCP